jgi:hypothetical protein
MNNNIREYQTIKFFRGKKRNYAEMQRLADERKDFEYRRLLIEENELDLHVAFSKMIVWKWISWLFLVASVICFGVQPMFYTLIALSFISQILSFRYKRFFQFVFRGHNLALNIVDSVIENEYGIILPK